MGKKLLEGAAAVLWEGKAMNWQKEAINELRQYYPRKQSLENMAERRQALEERYKAIKCASADSTPVMGGTSRIEDSMINNIVERQKLELNIEATDRLVKITERGLDSLNDQQRLVLERFYMARPNRHVELLMEQLHVEQAQIYRLKDEALYRFTVSMFGLIDY